MDPHNDAGDPTKRMDGLPLTLTSMIISPCSKNAG